MQREEAFGPDYAYDETLDEEESPYVVYLRKEGEFLTKKPQALEGGKLVTIWNYPLRNKLWNMVYTDFHLKQHTFATADERGQVFHFSIKDRRYQSVKLASTGVSAVAYLQYTKDVLVIAYDNLTNVLVNTKTKEIVGNIQLPPNRGKVIAIKSHPFKPLLMLHTSDKAICMWDISTNSCLQTLECQERLIDITFECQGEVVIIGLETSGIFVYELETLQLLNHIPVPSIIGNATCLCFTTIPYSFAKSNQGHETPSKKPVPIYYYNLLVATSNNEIFSFLITLQDQERLPHGYESNIPKSAINPNSHWAVTTGLFGKFVLPGTDSQYSHHQQQQAEQYERPLVAPLVIQALPATSKGVNGMSNHYPRLVVLMSSGQLYLFQLEGFHIKSGGYLNILANLPSTNVVNDMPNMESFPLQNSQHQQSSLGPSLIMNTHYQDRFEKQIYHGLLGYDKDYLIVLGWDGAVRLFHIPEMYSSGYLVGNVLRAQMVFVPRHTKGIHVIGLDDDGDGRGAGEGKGGDNYYEFFLSDTENDSPANNKQMSQSVAMKAHPSHSSNIMMTSGNTTTTTTNSNKKHTTSTASSRSRQSMGAHSTTTTSHAPSSSSTRFVTKNHSTTNQTSSSSSSGNVVGRAAKPRAASTGKLVPSFVVGKTSASTMISTSGQQYRKSKNGELVAVRHPIDACALYELNLVSPKDMQINTNKLRAYLKKYDEYPEQYRGLIWRFLLRIPENVQAFQDLVHRGPHPAVDTIMKDYPLSSRKISIKLSSILSILVHWSPIFAEASYLPSLVFPFVLMYNQDDLSIIEIVMSILMYWGYTWHITHPNPPLHLLDSYTALVKYHDAQIYAHCQRYDVNIAICCWQMISTLFTELCARNVWLQVMDYLFSYFTDWKNLYLLPIAIIKQLKTAILACDTGSQIQQLLHSQQLLHIHGMLSALQDVIGHTPEQYLTALSTRLIGQDRMEIGKGSKIKDVSSSVVASDDVITNNPNSRGGNASAAGAAIGGGLDEQHEARANLALGKGCPKFPLPKEHYPIYDGYPQQIMNLQLQERQKLLTYQQQMQQQQTILAQLQERIKESNGGVNPFSNIFPDATSTGTGFTGSSMNKSGLGLNTSTSSSSAKQSSSGFDIKKLPYDLRTNPALLPLTAQHETLKEEQVALQELINIQQQIAQCHLTAQQQQEARQQQSQENQKQLSDTITALMQQTEHTLQEKNMLQLQYLQYQEYNRFLEFQSLEEENQKALQTQRDDWLSEMSNYLQQAQTALLDQQSQMTTQWTQEDSKQIHEQFAHSKTIKELAQQEQLQQLHSVIQQNMEVLSKQQDQQVQQVYKQRLAMQQDQLLQQIEDVQSSLLILLQKQQLVQSRNAEAAERAKRMYGEQQQQQDGGNTTKGGSSYTENKDIYQLQENIGQLQKQYNQLITQQKVLQSKITESGGSGLVLPSSSGPSKKGISTAFGASMTSPGAVSAPSAMQKSKEKKGSQTGAGPGQGSGQDMLSQHVNQRQKDVEIVNRMSYELMRSMSQQPSTTTVPTLPLPPPPMSTHTAPSSQSQPKPPPSRHPPSFVPPPTMPTVPPTSLLPPNVHLQQPQAQPQPHTFTREGPTANRKSERKVNYTSDTDSSIGTGSNRYTTNTNGNNGNSNREQLQQQKEQLQNIPQWQSENILFPHGAAAPSQGMNRNVAWHPSVHSHPNSPMQQPSMDAKIQQKQRGLVNHIPSMDTMSEVGSIYPYSSTDDLFFEVRKKSGQPQTSEQYQQQYQQQQQQQQTGGGAIFIPEADENDDEFMNTMLPMLPMKEAIHQASSRLLSSGPNISIDTATARQRTSTGSGNGVWMDMNPLDVKSLPPTWSGPNSSSTTGTNTSAMNSMQRQFASVTSPRKLLYRTKSSESFRQSFYNNNAPATSATSMMSPTGGNGKGGGSTSGTVASPIGKISITAASAPPRSYSNMSLSSAKSPRASANEQGAARGGGGNRRPHSTKGAGNVSDFTIDSDAALWAYEHTSSDSPIH